jgi:fatty-acyl-CoA synthase
MSLTNYETGRAYGGPLVEAASSLTVDALFRSQVRQHPERPAIDFGDRKFTYGGLDERVGRLTSWLAANAIGRGDRIAVVSENRLEYVEMELAAARIGAIVAAQNWRLAPAELEHCLELVEPALTFVSERFEATLAGIRCNLGRVLRFGADYERRLAECDVAPPRFEPRAEDGLVILYTSGTTGLPKGAVISQRAIVARAQVGLIDGPIEPESTFVAWAPMFHMVSTDNILATLISGGKVVLLEGFDPAAIVALLPHEEIGWLQILPGTVEQIVAELRRTGITPKRVRAVGCMADLVPLHQIAELTSLVGAPYVNSFGSTETGSPPGSAATIPIGEVPKSLSKRLNSFCDIRLVDADDNDVRDGEPGEVVFRGATLFSGYWKVPPEQHFSNGWFHTGDVFRRNADGTFDFVDRRKYLIKSGGENIYPAEIERILLGSARVADAVVVRRPDSRWGEVPVAFIVRSDETLTADDAIEMCRGKIANYKLPKAVRFVRESEIPRSATGKAKRHELEALLAREAEGQAV